MDDFIAETSLLSEQTRRRVCNKNSRETSHLQRAHTNIDIQNREEVRQLTKRQKELKKLLTSYRASHTSNSSAEDDVIGHDEVDDDVFGDGDVTERRRSVKERPKTSLPKTRSRERLSSSSSQSSKMAFSKDVRFEDKSGKLVRRNTVSHMPSRQTTRKPTERQSVEVPWKLELARRRDTRLPSSDDVMQLAALASGCHLNTDVTRHYQTPRDDVTTRRDDVTAGRDDVARQEKTSVRVPQSARRHSERR